jgi:branched-chain amino acid transport system substrate-binding protein
MAETSRRFGLTRRRFMKASAFASATAVASPILAAAVWPPRSIKLGYVSPQTGPLASFADADKFVITNFMKSMKGGLRVGGSTYPVEVLVRDSRSDPDHAAEVAKDMIVRGKIDLMLVGGMPQTTNPVSTQCEIAGLPCVSTTAPWQPYFIGRQSNLADPNSWKPFNYT